MDWTGLIGKTLWDWLQLVATLAVPLALGIATFRFNAVQAELAQKQRDTEQERALDQQQQTALQSYLDHMSDLLLGNSTGKDSPSLGSAQPNDEISQVARARTLTVLRSLDERRKGVVLQFLHDAKLIAYTSDAGQSMAAIINLHGADLIGTILSEEANLSAANLSGANLSGANLNGANLSNVNLSEANLNGANLSGANLSGADLSVGTNLGRVNLTKANLNGANLTGADLSSANLTGANLSDSQLTGAVLENADLSGAELWHANLPQANLSKAKLDGANLGKAYLGGDTYLVGATYTRRTNWPDQFHPEKEGAIETQARGLPAFVDFTISPSHYHLANATLKTDNLQFEPDYVKLGPDQKIVIEFDLEKNDLEKIVIIVRGLISQAAPNNAGYAPISLQLNQHDAFRSNYTIPGGGYQPISQSFPAPPEQLMPGSNTLTLIVASNASTYFWLYRLEVGLKLA